MGSDCEAIPGGFTKEEADRAELLEAQNLSTSGMSTKAVTCQVYWPSPHKVCEPFLAKYNQLGGPNSFLLYPKSVAVDNPNNSGKRQDFLGGNLYWSSDTGARPVTHDFLTKYGDYSYEAGFLGYPTTDEIILSNGRRQEFQGGWIYWSPQTGAHTIRDEILNRYTSNGGQAGFLGYPSSDEKQAVGVAGRKNEFEHGVIYWSSSSGAHAVSGGILKKWSFAGYETGTYGFPTSEQTTLDDGTTVTQTFQSGSITAPGPKVDQLSTLLPGTTPEGVLEDAIKAVEGTAFTLQTAIEQGLIEVKKLSSGDGHDENEKTRIPAPRLAGHVFYSDASTLGWHVPCEPVQVVLES